MQISHAQTHRLSTLPKPRTLIGQILALAGQVRQRRALLRLDDHMLRDIGVTRAEAEAEAARPVWDAPEHWKR